MTGFFLGVAEIDVLMIRFAVDHGDLAGSASPLFAGGGHGDSRRAQSLQDGLSRFHRQVHNRAREDDLELAAVIDILVIAKVLEADSFARYPAGSSLLPHNIEHRRRTAHVQLEVGAVQRREYLFYFTTCLPRVQTGNYSDILKRINAVSEGHIFITGNEIVKLRRKRVVRQRLRHREQRRDTNSARHEDRPVTVSSQGEIVAGKGHCQDIPDVDDLVNGLRPSFRVWRSLYSQDVSVRLPWAVDE